MLQNTYLPIKVVTDKKKSGFDVVTVVYNL